MRCFDVWRKLKRHKGLKASTPRNSKNKLFSNPLIWNQIGVR